MRGVCQNKVYIVMKDPLGHTTMGNLLSITPLPGRTPTGGGGGGVNENLKPELMTFRGFLYVPFLSLCLFKRVKFKIDI